MERGGGGMGQGRCGLGGGGGVYWGAMLYHSEEEQKKSISCYASHTDIQTNKSMHLLHTTITNKLVLQAYDWVSFSTQAVGGFDTRDAGSTDCRACSPIFIQ